MTVLNTWSDLKFACHSLARQRSFSLMSIGILAIGIAGMATVFSLFNGLYLRPFPVPNPNGLTDLNETAPKWGVAYAGIAYPDFHAWREQNKSFESMYAWTLWGANLSVDGKVERVNVLVATHDYFDVLGIVPVLGRRFTSEEDQPNGPKVALLSYGLWKRMSGRDPAVLGQTLRLDGNAYTVIGVLPPDAGFPVDIDVLQPLAADPLKDRDSWCLSAIGRMKKDVTVEQARDDLTRIHRSLAEQNPANNEITSPTVCPLRQKYLGDYWQGITILLGAVALVLLIACCNVASIMLARGSHRRREIATRRALGATGGRIIRHVLTESILLSAVGGIIGILVADVALTLMTTRFRELMDIPRWLTCDMDIRCSLFCVATPGYLQAMGIKLLSGRFFDEADNRSDGEKTAIVNESFARHFWPGQDAIDRRIRIPLPGKDWMRVVGVTADVKHYGLEQPMRLSVYVPYGHDPYATMFGVVRTAGNPISLVPSIREIVRSADADLPVHNIKTMSDRVRASMLFRLMYSSMFLVYGAIAAIMAFAGIYGVISYWAGQRTQEIGIRMALGARAADVVTMVIREGLRLVGAGMAIGLIAALGLSRLLAGTLYHVSPMDLTTFVTTTVLLVTSASLACYLPARRAARIDPMAALRHE